MRYLIDTNIFIYTAIDDDYLSPDVRAIMSDYDNTFCMSVESVRELIVAYNNGKYVSKFWKSAREMVKAITEKYFIRILPIGEEHLIIAHAITNRMPLISSDQKFKFYENQGLELIFNER